MDPTRHGEVWCCTNPKCKRVLWVLTPLGELWLNAETCGETKRYRNVVWVRCVCGKVNLWYLRPGGLRRKLDELEA